MYGDGSYDAWIWRLERSYLLDLIDKYCRRARPRYLDFACGTGRIIAALEERTAEPTGVDVSAGMLELAQQKLKHSRLVLGDPTTTPSLIPGPYDLITAFRFFLNAPADLRSRTLQVLHSTLSNDGLLVLNVHGNTTSLRAINLLARRLHPRSPDAPKPKQLSAWSVRRLLRRHGFEVLQTRGYGFLPARWHYLIAPAASKAFERLGTLTPAKYLAVHLLFVCRKQAGIQGSDR